MGLSLGIIEFIRTIQRRAIMLQNFEKTNKMIDEKFEAFKSAKSSEMKKPIENLLE